MNAQSFIQKAIENAKKKLNPRFDPIRYNGNNHLYLGVSNPEKHKISAAFKKQFPDISFDKLISTLNALNKGKTFEDKTIGPMILMKYKNHLINIEPHHIDRWLENLEGWCEIDTLCQSTFDATHLLSDWETWEIGLIRFSQDKNISKRRASLVLLCKPARTGTDKRICDLALKNVEKLKHEKDILITKAISWILRSMIKNFKSDVQKYLDKNENSLPKIAVRETKKKLETGKKTSKKSA